MYHFYHQQSLMYLVQITIKMSFGQDPWLSKKQVTVTYMTVNILPRIHSTQNIGIHGPGRGVLGQHPVWNCRLLNCLPLCNSKPDVSVIVCVENSVLECVTLKSVIQEKNKFAQLQLRTIWYSGIQKFGLRKEIYFADIYV